MAEAIKPVIRGGGITLRNTKDQKSSYWIFGTGFKKNDAVNVYERTSADSEQPMVLGALLWSGTVKKCDNGKARVELLWKKPVEVDTDNLINVAVTVTSGGVTSDPYSDTVVINAPDPPAPPPTEE